MNGKLVWCPTITKTFIINEGSYGNDVENVDGNKLKDLEVVELVNELYEASTNNNKLQKKFNP